MNSPDELGGRHFHGFGGPICRLGFVWVVVIVFGELRLVQIFLRELCVFFGLQPNIGAGTETVVRPTRAAASPCGLPGLPDGTGAQLFWE